MTNPLPLAATEPPPQVQPVSQVLPPAINLRLNKLVVNRLDRLPGKPRGKGFHPSELHRMCPVFHYFTATAREGLSTDAGTNLAFLRSCYDSKADQFPGHLQLEFELGDAIHAQVQFHLGVNGVLWGRWMCPHCEARTEPGWMPRVTIRGRGGQPVVDGAPCTRCKGRNRRQRYSWRYLEPSIKSDEWGVNGRCDGDIRVSRVAGKGKKKATYHYRCALEIKSINEYGWSEGRKKAWEEVALMEGWTPPADWTLEPARAHQNPDWDKTLPLHKHKTQANTYAWLMGVPFLYFVYVNKNKASKWKEMMVPTDLSGMGIATQKMTAANQGMKLGRPPLEARICPDIREDSARNCPAVERCFGCKPAENFWDDPLKG